MLRESYPFYLANRAEMPNTDLEVIDKYSGEVATRVATSPLYLSMTSRSVFGISARLAR